MNGTQFFGMVVLALGLYGCGGGGGAVDQPQDTPAQPAEIFAAAPPWIGSGEFQYSCRAGGDPCKLGFEVTATDTNPETFTTTVAVYRADTETLIKELASVPSSDGTTTFKVEPNVVVEPGATVEYRITSSATAVIKVEKITSWTGDTVVDPTVKVVPPAEIKAAAPPWTTAGKFQYSCPSGEDSCKLMSFTVTVSGTKPNTETSVSIYKAGSDTLIERHTAFSAGGDATFTVEPNVVVEPGATVEYRITSDSTSIGASRFVSRTGDIQVRPKIQVVTSL